MNLDLATKQFELIENEGGYATQSTLMVFDESTDPFRATYTGPNVVFGHAIVTQDRMMYHALDTNGQLTAGAAQVSTEGTLMVLHWRWLTGDLTNGVSKWRQVDES